MLLFLVFTLQDFISFVFSPIVQGNENKKKKKKMGVIPMRKEHG
jgi:hypothetical protein